MHMTLIKSISEQIPEIEARIRAQLTDKPSLLMTDLEQLIFRGWRNLRPTLTLIFGRMSDADPEALINLAAAIEMLSAATLVHDDLVDVADQRHTGPTINPSFRTSAAVLAGDLAFAAAAQLAAATNWVAVMQKFSETLQFIVSGEITHMFRNGQGVDRDSYYHWIHAKTASLFELACETAILIGTQEDETMSLARQFGYQIGMAYQISNDIRDFSSDTANQEKPIGSSLRQGILSLPAIYYFESHPENPLLHSLLHKNGHSQEDLDGLIVAIRQSKAVERSLDEVRAFGQRGREVLMRLPNTPERAELEQLIGQIITRND